MRARQRELARLWQVAVDRAGWHWFLTFVVSLWAAVWIGGQFVATETAPSPLTVLVDVAVRFGFDGRSWADRVSPEWGGIGGATAMLGGLLWACTSERGQLPAVFGWIAVMLAAEGIGYRPAVLTALAVLLAVPVLLWLAALLGGRFVDRRAKLLPRDVLRAGITAATLSAIVPVFAFGACLARLLRPYLTRAPRLMPSGERGAHERSARIPGPQRASAGDHREPER